MDNLTKIEFTDHLYYFYQFEREYGKYLTAHRRLLMKYGGENVDYFVEIRPVAEKVEEISLNVIDEIRKTLSQMTNPEKARSYLSIIQEFIDHVYERYDAQYANEEEDKPIFEGLLPCIHEIQRVVRSEYLKRFIRISDDSEDKKPSVGAYAIAHVYKWKTGGQGITRTTVNNHEQHERP